MYDLKCLLVLKWKKKHTIHVTTLKESFLLANECQIYVSKVLSILPLGNFSGEVDQWDSRLTLLTWTPKDSHGCCINCNFCQYFTWKEKVVLLCLYILSNISNSHLWKTYGKTDSYTDIRVLYKPESPAPQMSLALVIPTEVIFCIRKEMLVLEVHPLFTLEINWDSY